jgi:tetratricopeptide (TPR) repeat protein
MARYRAFISYSHADQAFARRLQRRLESYRVPRGLGSPTAAGGERLGPIFLDTSDLAAATRLTGALTDALRDSDALVVVCSPSARGSEWIEQEIRAFREAHGTEALILPIVAPAAGDEPAEALFPAVLAGAVPLAADARPDAEGSRIALLKLIAGLLGVGLDQLIRRDTRRRQRRLLAATAASAVIALTMTFLAFQAISARDDARRRLSQSEDLIGFMLGDLREQLAPLGQVRVLQSVGDKALEYFASLDPEDLTSTARLRQSRALYQIGDVYYELGAFHEAHRSFALSLRIAKALAREAPDDPERLFELAQAHFWVAYAAFSSASLDVAEQHFVAYRDTAERLLELGPENVDWAMETFWASNNLGSLAFRQSDFHGALGYFETALTRMETILERAPSQERLTEKSATQSWLASTHYRLGQLSQARQAFLQALASGAGAESAFAREDRSYQLAKLARVELYLGDLDGLRQRLAQALALNQELSRNDPDSRKFLYGTTLRRTQIGLLASAAPAPFAELRRDTEILLATDAPPPNWRSLALQVARLGLLQGHPDAQTWAETLLEGDLELVDPDARLDLLTALAAVDAQWRQSLAEATMAAETAYAGGADLQLALPLIRAYAVLGDEAAASSLTEALLHRGVRHPELANE